MRFTKPIAAALALTVGVLAFSGVAEARHRHRHGGDAFVAGIAGFAAGALLSGALSQPRYPQRQYYYYEQAPAYYAPPPVVYRPAYQPAPVYYNSGPQPWTEEWFAYCDYRYQSFNPRTGYFLGFDGQYHFCR